VRHVIIWALLLFAWLSGTLAINIWPELDQAERALLDNIRSTFFFRPFHYLSACLLLLFFIQASLVLWRRIIYEWKLSFLFHQWPIQLVIVALLLVGIHWRLIAYFGLPALVATLAIVLYEAVNQLMRRKKGLIELKK
jgi:hypothetical protein